MNRTLPLYIRRFVGQEAGELYQTKLHSPPPTILMQTLDRLRGELMKEKTGYATWNILNIWKDTRPNLGGADLSGLNLLKTGLQYVSCYCRNGCRYNSAVFDNSLIADKFFLP